VSVTKMEVSRDVVGSLCSKTKERELVVGDAKNWAGLNRSRRCKSSCAIRM